MKDLANGVELPHHVVTACINALVRSKDVIKKSVKVSAIISYLIYFIHHYISY
jgi:hypothetical protein